jgi:hypothetical protein
VPGAGRGDLAAEAAHRRRVDRREAHRQGTGHVAQLEPRQRRGEQDVDVATAGRRDIGQDPAAAPGHQPGDRLRLDTDLSCGGDATFITVLDNSIVNVTAGEGEIKIYGQHPACTRGGIEDRHRRRLVRRLRR